MKAPAYAMLLVAALSSQALAAGPPSREEREKAARATEHEDPTVGKNAASPAASTPPQPGAINPATGQYYPPTGNGDVINPATGERYLGIPGGYVNPNTGEFMPKIR